MTTPAPQPTDAPTPSVEPVETQPPAPENLDDLSPEQAAEIEANAVDARVRRAPRFGAFIATGVVIGAVLGVVLSKIVGAVRHDPTNTDSTAFFVALSLAMVGALLAGYLAVRADRRS